jgi:hypothetical protein
MTAAPIPPAPARTRARGKTGTPAPARSRARARAGLDPPAGGRAGRSGGVAFRGSPVAPRPAKAPIHILRAGAPAPPAALQHHLQCRAGSPLKHAGVPCYSDGAVPFLWRRPRARHKQLPGAPAFSIFSNGLLVSMRCQARVGGRPRGCATPEPPKCLVEVTRSHPYGTLKAAARQGPGAGDHQPGMGPTRRAPLGGRHSRPHPLSFGRLRPSEGLRSIPAPATCSHQRNTLPTRGSPAHP